MLDQLEDVWMWMSAGNTSSSLHFDTDDNMIAQIEGTKEIHVHLILTLTLIEGTKEIYVWDPVYGREMYAAYHDKFGLSPINTEKVDLNRFPRFADAPYYKATLNKGDILYIPSHWWHQIRSIGHNIMLNWNMYPFGAFSKYQFPRWDDEIQLWLQIGDWSENALMEAKLMLASHNLSHHECSNWTHDNRTLDTVHIAMDDFESGLPPDPDEDSSEEYSGNSDDDDGLDDDDEHFNNPYSDEDYYDDGELEDDTASEDVPDIIMPVEKQAQIVGSDSTVSDYDL